MSRFWLDKKKVQILQVLLVLFLISPLNDYIVVVAEMDLKFKKTYLDCEYIIKEFIQAFKFLVFCPKRLKERAANIIVY